MITVSWADSRKKILIWRFGQRWTPMDFLMACQTSQKMTSSVSHSVDVLVDLSLARFYPINLIYLARTGMRMRSENISKTVVITESQLWSRLYQHLCQIYPTEKLAVEFVSSQMLAMKSLQSYLSDDQYALT